MLMEVQPVAGRREPGRGGGVVLRGRPCLDKPPAALLGFLGFHSSIILIFSSLKSVFH